MSTPYTATSGEMDGAVVVIEKDRRALLRFTTSEPEHDGTGASRVLLAGGNLAWLNSGRAPLLLDHYRNTDSLIGIVEGAWIASDEARAIVRFGTSPRACIAWNDVQAGVLCNVSMGYTISRSERTLEGILHTEWTPNEISLVWAPGYLGARVLHRNLTTAEHLALLAERDAVEAARAHLTTEQLAQKLDAITHALHWRRWAEVQAPTLAEATGGDAALLAPVLAHAVDQHLAVLKEMPR